MTDLTDEERKLAEAYAEGREDREHMSVMFSDDPERWDRIVESAAHLNVRRAHERMTAEQLHDELDKVRQTFPPALDELVRKVVTEVMTRTESLIEARVEALLERALLKALPAALKATRDDRPIEVVRLMTKGGKPYMVDGQQLGAVEIHRKRPDEISRRRLGKDIPPAH